MSILEVSDGALANKLLNGEKLILSRLIGHPELEPVRAPLFTRRQIEEAKIAIAEEKEAQRKAGNKYSGTPGGAATPAATPTPTAKSKVNPLVSIRNEIRQTFKTGPRHYQKDPALSNNIRWSIGDKCWNCSISWN